MKFISCITIYINIFIFGFAPNAYNQTYSSVVNDDEILNFVNWLSKNYKILDIKNSKENIKLDENILKWVEPNFTYSSENHIRNPEIARDSYYIYSTEIINPPLFKDYDRNFISEQFSGIKTSIWSTSIKKADIVKTNDQTIASRYFFSTPLFSLDKNLVIIKVEYVSKIYNTRVGYYYFSKRKRNNWNLTHSLHYTFL